MNIQDKENLLQFKNIGQSVFNFFFSFNDSPFL